MKILSEAEIQYAIELFNSGMSLTKISKQLGVSRFALTKKIKNAGLTVIPNGKKSVNSNYFSNINEHSSYWLGFLMADSHVDIKANNLELTSKDRDHIEKFKTDLQSDHKISEKCINGSYYYRLSLSDKQIVTDLQQFGFYNNKTYGWDIPSIPKEFIKFFICGLFDGDGCIRLRKSKIHQWKGKTTCSIVCYKKETLQEIKNIIIEHTGIEEKHINIYDYENRIPELCISSVKAVQIFLDWIYKDSDIYLNRKYEKYLEFCRLETRGDKK